MQILPSDLLAPVDSGRPANVPTPNTDVFADILIAAFEARLAANGDDDQEPATTPHADDDRADFEVADAAPHETRADEAAANDEDEDAAPRETDEDDTAPAEAAASESATQPAQAKLGPDANGLATAAQSETRLAVETLGAAGTNAATAAKLSDNATAAAGKATQPGAIQTSTAAPTQQSAGTAQPGTPQAAAAAETATATQAGPQTQGKATQIAADAATTLRPLNQAEGQAVRAGEAAQNTGPETNVVAGRTIKVTEAPAEVLSRPSTSLTPGAGELTASLRGDRPELGALNAPGQTAMAAARTTGANANAGQAGQAGQPAPDLMPNANPAAAQAAAAAPTANTLAAAARGATAPAPLAAGDGGPVTPTALISAPSGEAPAANQPNAARGATASQTAATAKPFAHHLPSPPPEQLALHIQRAFRAGTDRLQVQMRPPELGQVDIELEMAKSGKVKAVVVVEKPETLDMLQRDARSLERALQQAGLDADGSSLEFNLRGEGGDSGATQQQAHGRSGGEAETLDDAAEAAVADEAPADVIEDDRVDVRV